jgi:DNA-binding XRE family transcriptional regulator
MREILFPELAGELLERGEIKEPSAGAKDAVNKRREAIAARLKALRNTANLTQKQLAEKSGLPQSHISRLEAGQHGPSLKTVLKLASALGVSLVDLDPAQQ